MALLGAVACMSGLVDCTGGSSPTLEIDQCEETDKQLKEEYGDDYLTNRTTMPITAYGLQYIKSIGCETTFGYDTLADEFCQSLENYNAQIGGGVTCGTTRDPTNSMRSRWCLNEEGPDTETINSVLIGADASNRLKGDSKCSQVMLSNKYDETWVKYCKANPGDSHCTCYNMKNNVCGIQPDAAGCTYYKVLEENKEAFSTSEERAALEEGEEVASYNILKTKGHCRPRSCDSGYIPPNVKSDCESTYQICGKDIDIRTHTNNQLAVKCNFNLDRVTTLPDWWNEERDTSFMDNALAAAAQRAKDAKDAKDVERKKLMENLSYGVFTVSLCSLCMVVIMIVLGGSKRR